MADTTDMAAEPVRSRPEETVAGTEATPPTTLDLAWLYRLHADRSRRLAYLLTGDLQLAEDVVQEAFIRVGRDSDGCGQARPSRPTSSGRWSTCPTPRTAPVLANVCGSNGPAIGPTLRRWSLRSSSLNCGMPFRPSPSASEQPSCCASGSTCPRSGWPTYSGAARAR